MHHNLSFYLRLEDSDAKLQPIPLKLARNQPSWDKILCTFVLDKQNTHGREAERCCEFYEVKFFGVRFWVTQKTHRDHHNKTQNNGS